MEFSETAARAALEVAAARDRAARPMANSSDLTNLSYSTASATSAASTHSASAANSAALVILAESAGGAARWEAVPAHMKQHFLDDPRWQGAEATLRRQLLEDPPYKENPALRETFFSKLSRGDYLMEGSNVVFRFCLSIYDDHGSANFRGFGQQVAAALGCSRPFQSSYRREEDRQYQGVIYTLSVDVTHLLPKE